MRTGGRGKHNIFSLGGAFRKAKYKIRRRRKNRNWKARAGKNSFSQTLSLFARPSEKLKILFKKSVFLLDVRQPDEFEASHIEGFHLIPLHELKSRIDELGPHKGKEILVMCHHGPRSLYAAQLLKTLGFNAKSISGGLALWSETIDSPVPKYAKGPFGVIRA